MTVNSETTTQIVKEVKPRGKNSRVTKPGSKAGKIGRKAKLFAQEYVKTNNGTQSALKTYNTTNPKVASSIATENLAKPVVQEEIARLIAQHISKEEIMALHVRNAKQTDSLPTSQKAVESLEVLTNIAIKEEKKLDNVTINVVNPQIIQMVSVFEESLKKQLGYGKSL